MSITIGWATFDAAHPPVSVQVGFAEFDARAGSTDVVIGWAEFDAGIAAPSSIYGGGGARSRYHDEVIPQRQFRIRVHAENDEEEQIVLNLIMEFARHVL